MPIVVVADQTPTPGGGPAPTNPGPVVTTFTQEWFDSLPEFMRAADPGTGDHLLRFLSLLGDQADAIRAVYRRIDFVPPDEGGPVGDVSELVSADLADPAWLPWLALAVGAPSAGLTVQQQRDSIRTTGGGWRGPTKAAIAAAAGTALIGTRYARVLDHTTNIGNPGMGGVWDVTIITRPSETPSTQAVLDAITNAGAKPAGVHLYARAYTATVGTLQARRRLVSDYAGATVTTVSETGL